MFGKSKASKVDESSKKESSKPVGSDIHRLYAICRRLESRLANLENRLTADRRDINRLDKQLRREVKSTQSFLPTEENPVLTSSEEDPGLVGIPQAARKLFS